MTADEIPLQSRGEDKNEAAVQRKHAEKAELDKLNKAYAKQMQRYPPLPVSAVTAENRTW